MNEEHLRAIENACGAAGYTPIGADPRALAIDGCNYVRANSAPEGEEELWSLANMACGFVEAFMARPMP